ncbi:MAG: tyrosine-type recombinase/integrase [Fuerstiella sp.]
MRIPKMQHFKPKNLARVRITGSDGKPTVIYLGPWGSDEAQQRYDEIIAKYLASSRNPDAVNVTLSRLCILYLDHCRQHYRKNGEETSEVAVIQSTLRPLVAVCGRLPVREFSPRKLADVREEMIRLGWVRKSINHKIRRIVRMLKWGVSQDFVSHDIYARCSTLPALAKGRTDAKEASPVKPAPLLDVAAVKRHLRPVVWDMIKLQYRTGMRPGEVRTLTVSELDVSGAVWVYVPASHKTEHHDRERRIFIGPKAQRILRAYMTADRERFVFESSRGKCYTKDSYNRAIRRACKAAGVTVWKPNQLRHNNGTIVRERFGIEAARTVLGHSSADMTEIYAERDFETARRVMAEIG